MDEHLSSGRPSAQSLMDLGARLVREMSPRYAGRAEWEEIRRAVEDGLSVEAVTELQAELKRIGVRRPSEYVEAIVTRATRQRRDRLKPEEGERLLRVAKIIALALDVWGDEEDAGAFLTSPHALLGGAKPIDRALSEMGARQVEDLLYGMDLGLPV
jgi:putative toxin-antitoxin system antitoxin component (TIGR02293 family)